MSRSKVSSVLIEIRSELVSSGRGSMPRARSRRSAPTLPGRSCLSSASVSAASAPIVSSPAARSRASERGPIPGRRRTSNGARNVASRPGGTTVSPPGFRRSLAILATTFEVATPMAAVRLVAPRTEVCTASASARASLKFGGHLTEVEVALVHPGALDGRHDVANRAPDRLRVLPVDGVPRPDEDRVRASAPGLRARHRGVDPELARLVVRRRDDAAALRIPADDERLRPQLGILELFDGGEERVQVEVPDDHRRQAYGPDPT